MTADTIDAKRKVVVPDVVGLKIGAAGTQLRDAGFRTISLHAASNKSSLARQSVISSLSVAGNARTSPWAHLPDAPGTSLAAGPRGATTWSGCFGTGPPVPKLLGMTFLKAKYALHRWSDLSLLLRGRRDRHDGSYLVANGAAPTSTGPAPRVWPTLGGERSGPVVAPAPEYRRTSGRCRSTPWRRVSRLHRRGRAMLAHGLRTQLASDPLRGAACLDWSLALAEG